MNSTSRKEEILREENVPSSLYVEYYTYLNEYASFDLSLATSLKEVFHCFDKLGRERGAEQHLKLLHAIKHHLRLCENYEFLRGAAPKELRRLRNMRNYYASLGAAIFHRAWLERFLRPTSQTATSLVAAA